MFKSSVAPDDTQHDPYKIDFQKDVWPKLKNSSGVVRTKSLFYELNTTRDHSTTVFTLKDQDHRGYYSLRKLYLAYATYPEDGEYDFAMTVFGSLSIWGTQCNSPMLKPYIKEWRDELRVRVKQSALSSITQDAIDEDSKTRITSAKYLLEKGWVTKGKMTKKQREELDKEDHNIANRDKYLKDFTKNLEAENVQ